jgi:hypothetical protein
MARAADKTIRNAGTQEEYNLEFSCFPAFLMLLSTANDQRVPDF